MVKRARAQKLREGWALLQPTHPLTPADRRPASPCTYLPSPPPTTTTADHLSPQFNTKKKTKKDEAAEALPAATPKYAPPAKPTPKDHRSPVVCYDPATMALLGPGGTVPADSPQDVAAKVAAARAALKIGS